MYMDEPLIQSVKRLARLRGVSEAMVLRDAVADYTSKPWDTGLTVIPKSLGIASGPGNLSEHTDELLADGFGRDRADR